MDKIFREIKQAIEEEMARQEGRPTGGGSRPQGRDASRYESWLEEEQERLRGDQPEGRRQRRSQQQPDLEDVVVSEAPQQQRERSRSQRRERREQRRREPRSDETTGAAEAAEAAKRARTEAMQRSTESERREPRATRQQQSSYDIRYGRSDFSTGIWRMLRTRQGLQQAILLNEIIGKPVSLRKPDDHLIS